MKKWRLWDMRKTQSKIWVLLTQIQGSWKCTMIRLQLLCFLILDFAFFLSLFFHRRSRLSASRSEVKTQMSETSLVVQWLGLQLSLQGARFLSLVWELRSWELPGQNTNTHTHTHTHKPNNLQTPTRKWQIIQVREADSKVLWKRWNGGDCDEPETHALSEKKRLGSSTLRS